MSKKLEDDTLNEDLLNEDSDLNEDLFFRKKINLPTVSILGRPNVGKSSLVNRIIGRRSAVVQDKPGITRDSVRYEAEWNGIQFEVLDTGGWVNKSKDFDELVSLKAESAIFQSDVIIFVVDALVGMTIEDEKYIKKIRQSKKPIFLVANKVDNDSLIADIQELWKLGLGKPYPISAIHGRGTADLLDDIITKIESKPIEFLEKYPRRVAIVGKPNVGKSTLINKLSKKDISIVHNESGTTIDPINSLIKLDEFYWDFVDTAGLRKKVDQADGFEFYASLRTAGAIESAELVLVLVDALNDITEQDQRIISQVIETGKALVILFNKWDEIDEYQREVLKKQIDLELDRVKWVSTLNISALSGRSLNKLEKYMLKALDSWDTRISTGRLNNWLSKIIAATPPPAKSGKIPKILFATQAGIQPPTFILFTSMFIDSGYRRFIERKIREEFGFEGTPIKIEMKIREKNKRL